uniref:DDE Tnp4 domain-containing protein n=1 Tax=Esox lucius TaxID=8010 RepID=A0AAY5KER0_ESOLU
MVDEFATGISIKSVMRAIYEVPFTCVSPCTMACPFLNDVLDEEALIFRCAFKRERVFRDRSDPLAFPDEYLHERYRFTGDGIRYCVALRFFRSGMFLYAVGHAEILNKGTICRCVRSVFGTEILGTHLYYLRWPQKNVLHQRDFYKIAAFPNVIGALDCTQIHIKRPSGAHEGDCVNRKSFHSINVQMICDAACIITNVEAKWPGSIHDSRVFRSSTIS